MDGAKSLSAASPNGVTRLVAAAVNSCIWALLALLTTVNFCFSADADYGYMEIAPGAVVPKLTLYKTIDLEPEAAVQFIQFSPNNRFVAIAYLLPAAERAFRLPSEKPVSRLPSQQRVVEIWGLEADRVQAKFYCPEAGDPCFDSWSQILWAKDSATVSFGRGPRWSALTGHDLPPDPVKGYYQIARLNKDGTKLMTLNLSGVANWITVYDTSDWTSHRVYADGLHILNAIWTSEDKLLIGVLSNPQMIGKKVDGYTFSSLGDSGFRLIDPAGADASKSLWFPAAVGIGGSVKQVVPSVDVQLLANNFPLSQVALGSSRLINDKTLDLKTYYTAEDIKKIGLLPGSGGVAFSSDGKYLFLKDVGWFDGRKPVTNAIIDAASGMELAKFGGGRGAGHQGIAVSPNDKMLGIGNVNSVQIIKMSIQ